MKQTVQVIELPKTNREIPVLQWGKTLLTVFLVINIIVIGHLLLTFCYLTGEYGLLERDVKVRIQKFRVRRLL
jgi:hypothetical protein